MSMLAGPRHKQKIINLRAKNNAWSNDSNKFGQRMLEKMGWSSGKGLGAKENGIIEHVIAKYKNDEKGLGFEDKNDQWTKHEDDFNALLANLSNTETKSTDILHSGVSLEKKSKKSKARIHYHKYTRGKDLSRYSEKDLANIFGKKSFKETKVDEILKEDIKTSEQIFTDKGNMDDYFKTKLSVFKSKLVNSGHNIDYHDVSDYSFQGFANTTEDVSKNVSNGLESQSFLFYNVNKDNNIEQDLEICENEHENKCKKKKKSKKKDLVLSSEIVEDTCTKGDSEICDNGEEIICKKRKKSKKKDLVLSSEIAEDTCTKGDSEICDNGEEIICKKRKKSKKKDMVLISMNNEVVENLETVELLEHVEVKVKKTKKKKIKNDDEEILVNCCDDQNNLKKSKKAIANGLNSESMEDYVPKKKKKRKHQDV